MINQIYAILEPRELKRLKFLFVAIVLMSLLQVLGIASIIPFINLVANPDYIVQNEGVSHFFEVIGLQNINSILIFTGIAVFVFMVFANVFSAFTTWLQKKVAWDIGHQLLVRLLGNYIRKPITFYSTHNSSELLADLVSEINILTTGLLIPFMEFFAKMLIILIIFGLLFCVNPILAVTIISSLSILYLLIYLAFGRSLKLLGERKQAINKSRFKNINELLSGIKTVRAFGKELYYFERIQNISQIHNSLDSKVFILYSTPKYFFELVLFGSIIGVTLFLIVHEKNFQDYLPIISLYAVAGYRVLPSLQAAYTAAVSIKHTYPIFKSLYSNLKLKQNELKEGQLAEIQFSKSINLTNITFSYPNESIPTFSEFNLQIKKGQTIAFIGKTGSGKTTLVDLIIGLITPQKGSIFIDNQLLGESNLVAWQSKVAYVPQEIFLFNDSVKNNIAIGIEEEFINEKLIEKVAKIAKIHTFITTELSEGYNTKVGERGLRLSGGQKQRLSLARALYKQPEILILDEPTKGLDQITAVAFIEELQTLAQNMTIIIVAHQLFTVRHADCIYLFEAGKVITSGSYKELLEENVRFQKMDAL